MSRKFCPFNDRVVDRAGDHVTPDGRTIVEASSLASARELKMAENYLKRHGYVTCELPWGTGYRNPRIGWYYTGEKGFCVHGMVMDGIRKILFERCGAKVDPRSIYALLIDHPDTGPYICNYDNDSIMGRFEDPARAEAVVGRGNCHKYNMHLRPAPRGVVAALAEPIVTDMLQAARYHLRHFGALEVP